MRDTWQFYWPHWWMLWMHHSAIYDPMLNIHDNTRAFGPLQWRYYDYEGSADSRSYKRGWRYAKIAFEQRGEAKAVEFLWLSPRDASKPFDKGIIDYVKENTK